MIKHYEGELGNFIYDDELFEIRCYFGKNRLHYIADELYVDLPEGCINTSYMFAKRKLPEGFKLRYFDTSNVKDMEAMFWECKLPEDFSLGDKFDTSNVTDMAGMFSHTGLPEGFTLGDRFDTSNVKCMDFIFAGCILPKKFTLGHKFNTNSVTHMEYAFSDIRYV